MSRRLYDDPDRLPAWATRLRCPRCKREWTVEEAREEAIDGAGRLVCWDCGEPAYGEGYGLIALRGESALEATGGELYAPVPHWFLRGEGPPVDPVERAVILAVWSREFGRDAAWPSVGALAAATGFGETTVRRALRRLEERRLMRVRREPGRPSRYSVAALMRGEADAGTPAAPADHPGRSGRGTPAAPAAEVDPGEVEPRGEPANAGSRTADAAARHSGEDPSEPDDWWGDR